MNHPSFYVCSPYMFRLSLAGGLGGRVATYASLTDCYGCGVAYAR